MKSLNKIIYFIMFVLLISFASAITLIDDDFETAVASNKKWTYDGSVSQEASHYVSGSNSYKLVNSPASITNASVICSSGICNLEFYMNITACTVAVSYPPKINLYNGASLVSSVQGFSNCIGIGAYTGSSWNSISGRDFRNINANIKVRYMYNETSNGCEWYENDTLVGSNADCTANDLAIDTVYFAIGASATVYIDDMKFCDGPCTVITPPSTFNITSPLTNQTILPDYYINLTSNESIVCSINDSHFGDIVNTTSISGTNYSFFNDSGPIPNGYYSVLLNCTNLTGGAPSNRTREFYANVVPTTFTGLNIYDDTTFDNFSVDVNNSQTTVDSGNIIFISPGTHDIFLNKTGYWNQSHSITIGFFPMEHSYNTSQSIVNFRITDLLIGTNLSDVNITIVNNDSGQINSIFNDYSNITTFYINGTNYTVTVTQSFFQSFSGAFSILGEQNLTIQINLSNLANLTIYDEATEGLFNISSADEIKILVFCEDRTYQININATNTIFPVNCVYSKFKFLVTYDTTSYYRTLIIPPTDVGNVPLYLINLNTDTAVYSTFTVDDLYNDYDNVVIYIYKAIGNGTFQITADFTDIENKIGAYLLENHEYSITLESSNQPTRVMGAYHSDVAGDKIMKLYTIDTTTQSNSFFGTVDWGMRIENRTGDGQYVIAFYRDRANQTDSVTFNIWQNAFNDTLLFTNTVTKPSDTSYIEYEYNVTDDIDSTILATFTIDHEELSAHTFGKLLSEVTEIVADIFSHISPEAVQWFFTLLIGTVALTATISSASLMALVLIALAVVFRLFNWYPVTYAILALAILVSLISLLKKGERKPI